MTILESEEQLRIKINIECIVWEVSSIELYNSTRERTGTRFYENLYLPAPLLATDNTPSGGGGIQKCNCRTHERQGRARVQVCIKQ